MLKWTNVFRKDIRMWNPLSNWLVSRTWHESELKKASNVAFSADQVLRARHRRELASAVEIADEVVRKCVRLDFRPESMDVYSLNLRFDARMFGRYQTREDMVFIAQRVAHMVEGEIATSKFIERAGS